MVEKSEMHPTGSKAVTQLEAEVKKRSAVRMAWRPEGEAPAGAGASVKIR